MLKKEKTANLLGAMLMSLSLVFGQDAKASNCKGVTLCSDLPLKDNCGFYINTGLIYQQMRISNTFASYNKITGPAAGVQWDPTTTYNMNPLAFKMDPGFKFGVGYENDYDDWKMASSFEWLRSTGTYSSELIGVITDTLKEAYFDNSNSYYDEDASLKIDYFLLDVYLSRGSFFSNKFAFEPLAGIKASWINYNGGTSFTNTASSSVNNLASNEDFLIVSKVNFWGVGPMVGFNSSYHMNAGWSLFSLSDVGILLGENSLTNYRGEVTVETIPGESKITASLQVLCPTVRNVFGIGYERYVMCDAQQLKLRAGFDTRYYFNQYPVAKLSQDVTTSNPQTPSIIENGSFGMVGLILDIGWSF